jgi:hypothetical protein
MLVTVATTAATILVTKLNLFFNIINSNQRSSKPNLSHEVYLQTYFHNNCGKNFVSEEARPFVDFCHSNYSSHCCQSSTVANAATKALATEAATEVIIITVASIATKALINIS